MQNLETIIILAVGARIEGTLVSISRDIELLNLMHYFVFMQGPASPTRSNRSPSDSDAILNLLAKMSENSVS